MKRKQANPLYDRRRTRLDTDLLDKAEMLKMLESIKARLEAAPDPKPEPVERISPLPPPPEKENLPEDQIQTLLKMAEASLRNYGELVPPREVFYATGTAQCAHCGETKPIAQGADIIGLKKKKDGSYVPQSWCNKCRSSPDSHPGRRRKV